MARSLYARLHRRFGSGGVSRRALLQRGLAAAGLLLLGGRDGTALGATWGRPAPARRAGGASPRIGIIGGGFAGLACARDLAARGCSVTVFEARGRVGGRVLSLRDLVPGAVVEGGAELIGANHPTWLTAARRYALPLIELDEESGEMPVFLDGRALSESECEGLFLEMDEVLRRLTHSARGTDPFRPWTHAMAASLDARSTGDWFDANAPSRLCRIALESMFASDNGVPTARQSLLGNFAQIAGGGFDQYWLESEVYRCGGGNQSLAFSLAEEIGAESIRLRTAVRRIVSLADSIEMTTNDGVAHRFDRAVVSVPPTVWREIEWRPAPPLPATPQMGSNVKLLVAVDRRFWRDAGRSPEGFSDGPVGMTWDGTRVGNGVEATALIGFAGGPAAEMLRSMAPAERIGAMARMYPDLPESARAQRFMDWPSDPWLKGGYSFPGPGEVTRLGPFLDAGTDLLQFAGEHTCYAFVGYMEGALQSGLRAARNVAASLSLADASAG